MTSNIKAWRFVREADSIFECVAVCHKRSGREDAMPMSMDYAGVYIARETEIIGVDDQPLQLRKYGGEWSGIFWDWRENL